MKKNIILLFKIFICTSFIFFLSCKRTNVNSNSSTAFFKYTVNGKQVQVNINYNNIIIGNYAFVAKYPANSGIPTTYDIEANSSGGDSTLILAIEADSLMIQNYHYDSTFIVNNQAVSEGVNLNGSESSVSRNGDYLDLNITSYSNGFVSGNFTAKMSVLSLNPSSPAGTTLITNGVFQNIQVTY
jgi:hypothetical protein